MVHRFGHFELDPGARDVRLRGKRVHVQPRVFDFLLYLLERPGAAVPREEILAAVWRDVAVEDGSLTRAVHATRTLLRRDVRLRGAIETIYGFGYRLRLPDTVPRDDAGDPADLVERRDLVERLAAALARAQAGQGGVVLISGEPGVGKTSVVRHVARERSAGFLVGEGHGLERFGAGEPYLPVLEALTRLARGNEETAAAIADVLRRAAPSWLAELPLLDAGSARDERGAARAGGEDGQPQRMLREGADAIELIAQWRPLLLVLEDLHWSDPSTWDLLAALARRADETRVLVLATVRRAAVRAAPELRSFLADLIARGLVEEIELEGLSGAGVARYLHARFDAEPPASLVEALHERTRGNPLFLVQIASHLADRGALRRTPEGALALDAELGEPDALPETLRQMIEYEIGRLEPEERAAVEAASVAGADFATGVLTGAVGAGVDEVEEACERLASREWLRFVGTGTWPDGSRQPRYEFRHALYADAVYEGIPAARRGRLHAAIAERLAATLGAAASGFVAQHFERAGQPAQAAPHRAAAAIAAVGRHAPEEAERHAQAGLDLLPAVDAAARDAVEVDLRFALAFAWSSRLGYGAPRAQSNLERAHELAHALGDVDREVDAIHSLVLCHEMRGEAGRARELAEELLGLAARAGDERHVREAHDALTLVTYFQGRFAECVDHARQAVGGLDPREPLRTTAGRTHDPLASCATYESLARWHLGDEEAAAAVMARALERAALLEHPFTGCSVHGFAAILCELTGDAEGQRHHAATCRDIGERHGIQAGRAIGGFLLAMTEPHPETRATALRAALEDLSGVGGLGATYFLEHAARGELEAGRPQEATSLLEVAFAVARTSGERNHEPALHLTAARLAKGRAARDEALAEAERVARELGSRGLLRRAAEARAALT